MTLDGDYRFVGTSSSSVCDACGKSSLKRTYVVEDTDTGEVYHLGADCAGKALGLSGTPRALAEKLRRHRRYRGTLQAPLVVNRDAVPTVIEGEIDAAAERAANVAGKRSLSYVGAGMTGIVFTDGKRAYKVARSPQAAETIEEEVEWFADAAKIPWVRAHLPGTVSWDSENRVRVSDLVRGRAGRWSDESALRDLHDEIEKRTLEVGWSAPEFKGDSYVIPSGGSAKDAILVDASMPSRVGDNLVRYVEDVVEGRRRSRESLDDLAFYLRREVIAKHNPRGTVNAEDMLRLFDKLEARGAKIDPYWRRH